MTHTQSPRSNNIRSYRNQNRHGGEQKTFCEHLKSARHKIGIQFDFATWEKFKEYMKPIGDYLHSVTRAMPEPVHINNVTITFTAVYGARAIIVTENTKTIEVNTESKRMSTDPSQGQQPPTKKRKVYTVNIVMQATSFDGLELITKCIDARREQMQTFAKLVKDCVRFLVTEIELRLPKKNLNEAIVKQTLFANYQEIEQNFLPKSSSRAVVRRLTQEPEVSSSSLAECLADFSKSSLGVDADRLFALLEIIIEGIEDLKNTSATTAPILARGNVGIALTEAAPVELYERDSYNRPYQEIDNVSRNTENHARLRETKDHIPLFDGSNEGKLMEFLTACDYAFEIIHPADEAVLARTIICTKLKGIALVEITNRNPHNYASLKNTLEACYARKKYSTRLHREFNYARPPGEEARVFGKRVVNLAAELYTATTEGNEYSENGKSAIHRYIKQQALVNYQLELNEKLQTIVRSRAFATLADATEAVEEKRMKGVESSNSRSNETTRFQRYVMSMPAREPPVLKCLKCGKLGHTGRECRNSRYGTRFSLPKPEGIGRVNNVIKHCTFCDKSGHTREECRNLHGKTTPAHAADTPKTRTPNVRPVQFREEKNRVARSTQSDEDSDHDEECRRRKPTRTENTPFLLDIGSAISFIKLRNFKGETLIDEEQIALTGITGYTIYTLGRFRATIQIGKAAIKHIIYVVHNDFPIDYEGILGIDFLQATGPPATIKKDS
ncbi:hypothetical protein EAI_03084 [Harpegnathos saltator]|uniref:CCHC-type domain-containing protein n=1 Tax=Harpegnathos saltator TaxID=610380 RepID=E2BG33_HARSA|nr:hypothetical protein EAI_03084 [Harpegnathos saltator]